MKRKILKFSIYPAFIIALVSGACLDSESIIFPVLFLLSFAWIYYIEKYLSDED